MRRSVRDIISLAAVLSLPACATIMHGTSQEIGFQSSPSKATVKVDNVNVGQTPMVAKLSRKSAHIIRMELDGYQPFEATVTKSVSGWVWGNIVFGGLIGLAVDAATGGLYKLSPEQVAAQMAQSAATQAGSPREESQQTSAVTRDGIYVRVVLTADPSWQRIGTLERE